jgi:DNA repair protein RadC
MNERPARAVPTESKDPRVRYRMILEPICASESFTAAAIHARCPQVTRQAVHEVIRRLCSDGWLIEQFEAEPAATTRRGGAASKRLRWQRSPQQFSAEHWIDNQLCGTQVTASPPEERPRERLLRLGAENLRTSELLAILIRAGRKGESAVQAGQRIANQFAERLDRLHATSLPELKQLSSAISEPAYCQIMAGIELGRRVATEIRNRGEQRIRITSADAAVDYCRELFARLAIDGRQEEFHVVTLDTKYQPLTNHRITVGTLDASLVHPREVFRPAIRDAAAAVLLVHNHPSGDPTPSGEDRKVTRQLEAAGRTVGIQVLDHIVVAGETALSLKQWEADGH